MAIVTDEDRAARGTWCAEFMVRFGCNEFIGQPCFVVPLPALDELFAAKREAEERAALHCEGSVCSICAGEALLFNGTACVCRDGTAAGEAIALRERVRELEALLPGECCRGSNPACAAGCAVEQAGLAVVRERDALRERVREVQHAESKRHAELESRVAKYEYAFRRAREWTERHDLKATWALDPSGPFWSMTSKTARTALAELIDERDAARARSARLAAVLRYQRERLAEKKRCQGDPAYELERAIGDIDAALADAPAGRYVTPEQVEAIRLLLAFVASDDRLALVVPRRTTGGVAWDKHAIQRALATLAPLLDETERPS